VSVTIREVARAASVSVATVSRALNGKGPVREETQRRIRAVVDRLRYSPHGAALSLITRKTNTLGVLLPDVHGEFFSELIRGIDSCARERGYHLLVSGSHSDRAEIEAVLRATRGRVDGMIVMSPEVDPHALKTNSTDGIPIVLVNGMNDRRLFDSIHIDNFGGARAMVDHLISFGHRRIAHLAGPAGNRDATERLRGYRDAMRSFGGRSSRELELTGDFREDAGYQAGRRLLTWKDLPTAVFAANDAMAIGLLACFQESGVRVPQDVAVAGFDDIPIARFSTPPLSTVRVPIAELGARATRLLFRALAGTARRPRRQETLSTTLVVRESCGAAVGRDARPEGTEFPSNRKTTLPTERRHSP